MPYGNNYELPVSVKENLPDHGQDIYREAFNSAWKQYDTKAERMEGRTREETAHAVAWNAVKNVYEKNEEGEWVEKKKNAK